MTSLSDCATSDSDSILRPQSARSVESGRGACLTVRRFLMRASVTRNGAHVKRSCAEKCALPKKVARALDRVAGRGLRCVRAGR